MKKTLALGLIIIFLIGCMPQEETRTAVKYTFNNGLRLVMKENPDTGIVAIDFMIKRTPTMDENHALDNFVHRMLLAGTKTRTREQIVQELDDIGADIKAITYNEFSHIVVTAPSNKLSKALEILSDIIHNSEFSEEEIEKERTTILQEMSAKHDLPEIEIEELFMKTLFKNHPFENPPDGYPEEVIAITKEDLKKRHKDRYVGSNIVIGMAGNIDNEATAKAIDKLFGNIPKGTLLGEVPQHENTAPKREEKNFIAESFFINEGFITVPASNPEYMPIRVLGAVLGVGSGSRLFYNVREKQGLAYSIYIITPSVRGTGFFKIAAIVRQDALNKTIEEINKQIELTKTEQISEEELQHVKNKMKGFFILDHQRSVDQANYLAFYELQGLGYEHDAEYTAKIQAIQPEQLQNTANQYFNNPAIAIAGPFEDMII